MILAEGLMGSVLWHIFDPLLLQACLFLYIHVCGVVDNILTVSISLFSHPSVPVSPSPCPSFYLSLSLSLSLSTSPFLFFVCIPSIIYTSFSFSLNVHFFYLSFLLSLYPSFILSLVANLFSLSKAHMLFACFVFWSTRSKDFHLLYFLKFINTKMEYHMEYKAI